MLLRVREAAPATPIVVAMIAVASILTAVAVVRVARQHEVLRSGYELRQRSELVHNLRETQRQLQLERATLTAPDRIRRLAATLGMTPVAPDRIRIVHPSAHADWSAQRHNDLRSARGTGEPRIRDPHRDPSVALLP